MAERFPGTRLDIEHDSWGIGYARVLEAMRERGATARQLATASAAIASAIERAIAVEELAKPGARHDVDGSASDVRVRTAMLVEVRKEVGA